MKNKCVKMLYYLFLGSLFSCSATPSIGETDFVDYFTIQTIRTDKEHREIWTHIFTGNDEAGFRFKEYVFGSLNKIVKFSKFENEWNKVTEKQLIKLHEELLKAGLYNLKTEENNNDSSYRTTLKVRLNGEDKTLEFYSPPNSNNRKSVHNVIINFANRIGMDKPKRPKENTITFTESDVAKARKIKLRDLLNKINEFHGKKVSFIGYYHGEYEAEGIYIDKDWTNSRSVWKGFVSSFADPKNIKIKNDSWLLFEGIFLKGPAGSFGGWPGQITRLTKVQPISEQAALQGPGNKPPPGL